jgi:predicted nucleic acid-binding protein
MKTALDTSVVLDVLTADPKWADASEAALKSALLVGPLVIGECVLAEITPALKAAELDQFLDDWRILFLPSTRESARTAGEMYHRYLSRTVKKSRVLPDFLIAAHAQHHTGRLLARDRGYYRDYFSGLTLIEPKL